MNIGNRTDLSLVFKGELGFLIIGFFFVTALSADNPGVETFTIDGLERKAIVYSNSKPSSGAAAPVVFVFHGHGGTAQYVARRYRIHEHNRSSRA